MKQGGTTARGYGWRHRRLRAYIAEQVNAGLATCWRCSKPIRAGEPWDLGHDDTDRSIYRGPEHQACNRAAAARKRNKLHTTRRTYIQVDDW